MAISKLALFFALLATASAQKAPLLHQRPAEDSALGNIEEEVSEAVRRLAAQWEPPEQPNDLTSVVREAAEVTAEPMHEMCKNLVSAAREGKLSPVLYKNAVKFCGPISRLPPEEITELATAKANQVEEKIDNMENSAVQKRCAELEQKIEEAHRKGVRPHVEKMGLSTSLFKACRAFKDKDAEALHEAGNEIHEKMSEAYQTIEGKSVALGCKALLAAQNNGKAEWFESQPWYKKAMESCYSLHQMHPQEVEQDMISHEPRAEHHGEEVTAPELIKKSCDELGSDPHIKQMAAMPWFQKTLGLCRVVESEDMAALNKYAHSAESRFGMAVKQSCQELGQAWSSGEMRSMASHPTWLQPFSAACKMMAQRASVNPKGLAQRCHMMDRIKSAGKQKMYERFPWYANLQKMCKFVKNRGSMSGAEQVADTREMAVPSRMKTFQDMRGGLQKLMNRNHAHQPRDMIV